MDLGLRQARVLVAGSSRGIGRAVAEAFLEEGARVVLSGRNAAALDDAARALAGQHPDRVLSVAADLTDTAGIDAARRAVEAAWGGLDVLVANVGTGRSPAGFPIPEDAWTEAARMNLDGSRRLVEAFLPSMIAARRGTIVFVASIAGVEATAAPVAYAVAKSALLALSKGLARLVAREGIRVNAVAPGNILFEGGSWERHLRERTAEVQGYIDAEVPMGRFGSAREVADAIVFLASDRSAFTSGACLVIDGAQTRSF